MNDDLKRAINAMESARRDLLALIAPLTAEDFARARPGGWTLQRVLHHVIESEATYAKLLAHQTGRKAPALELATPGDAAEAAAELDETRTAVSGLVDDVDGEVVYRLVRFGSEEYSVVSVLENIAAHDRDHAGQIRELVPASLDRFQSSNNRNAANVMVRPATIDDVPRLNEIYNYYIEQTAITFDLVPFTVAERTEWFSHYATTGRHRLLVADVDGVVMGYTSSSQFRPKRAYDTTVEMSIICAHEAVGRGIGQRLYEAIFPILREEDIHMAVAGITLPNEASCALHERFGFERVAVLAEVGRKFDRYWDVAWYQRRL